MPNHQASEQMLGYLYQVRYALALLLENDNSDCQISMLFFVSCGAGFAPRIRQIGIYLTIL